MAAADETCAGPGKEKTQITVAFEAKRSGVDKLTFDLSGVETLSRGLKKDTPGDASTVLRAMQMGKGTFPQALIEIGLYAG